MGSKNCMNDVCRVTTSSTWKKGWSLQSGGCATLCVNCGSAYENSVFCETFHSDESGWRECRICGKLVHCGCIASRYLYEFMDFGGIGCGSCAKRLEIQSVQTLQIPSDVPNGNVIPRSDGKDSHPLILGDRIDDDKFSTLRLLQLTKALGVNSLVSAFEQHKEEEPILRTPESSKPIPNLSEPYSPSVFVTSDSSRPNQGPNDAYDTLAHPPLSFSLSTPSSTPSTILPFNSKNAEGSEQNKVSFQHRQKTKHGFPKPPRPSPVLGSETSKGAISQARVPRPPAEGRGRNQLLPRYWPRITEQELQQLSGDLKSTIVPLFEKMLSASDAGRIGRLVLPKACAETYFPTINQSEGIPIAIQDVKGKEWTFQFRFWPNNNSRMYVLEGVTPCIQNMQLQAGDTVIFSRREPGDQLIIGCRKTTNNGEVQEKCPMAPASESPSEGLFSYTNDNLNGGRPSDDSMQHSEKKKSKNIKNKRLLMHNDDAMELRITWEEAQELFRPSSFAQPTVVLVEGHEFEEFEEPPIFGKRTMFISQSSGDPEQLAQCDHCSKWRRVPVHALLPANWMCSDNIWDSGRCSCSASEEINRADFGLNSDNKKRRILESKLPTEGEPSGLDALATAAVLGDNICEMGESSTGPTTRHPRHRPGCTCIVCIQPPSGKGKHEATCKCNVCLTVRRRFKTLMMRKKKKQYEREAELAQEKDKSLGKFEFDFEREDMAGHVLLNMNHQENIISHGENNVDLEETSKGQLDLNSDPHHEDEILAEAAGMSLATLINAATTFPLDMHLGQNGISGFETEPCLQEGAENISNLGNLVSEAARQENS